MKIRTRTLVTLLVFWFDFFRFFTNKSLEVSPRFINFRFFLPIFPNDTFIPESKKRHITSQVNVTSEVIWTHCTGLLKTLGCLIYIPMPLSISWLATRLRGVPISRDHLAPAETREEHNFGLHHSCKMGWHCF